MFEESSQIVKGADTSNQIPPPIQKLSPLCNTKIWPDTLFISFLE